MSNYAVPLPNQQRHSSALILPPSGMGFAKYVLSIQFRGGLNVKNVMENLSSWWGLTVKVANLRTRRWFAAQQAFSGSLYDAWADATRSMTTADWNAAPSYAVDAWQRSVLFWDTMRERGNVFVEHERAGLPPVLIYDYELLVRGQDLERPVNYSLVRIIPPDGVEVHAEKRPYLIVDPRAGHGPGIGGFKEDSQVGVALRAGHPVYFVIFGPEPVHGQTIGDVIRAQGNFLTAIHRRHPDSPKVAMIGNCQGGWATMILAAARPDLVGPLVINGAPMSYWSGHLDEGPGKNPMRYLGGIFGGSWGALWGSDLGNGKFDGAYLVDNFERLNPANTYWDKYYQLYSKVDTERPRFLDFERWWGGFYLLNEAEMRDIVNQLFIGNRLARGDIKTKSGEYLDLKEIRTPIVVFSSAGDNITPPQQALNWIADVYESTEEIKANNQVIVALSHETVGHLGIFVSGKVAKKEHTAVVEVLEFMEHLNPGLYMMELHEETADDGESSYDVSFVECQLEDLDEINRLDRIDELPFELVAKVSEMNEVAYRLFIRPWVRSVVNEPVAKMARSFHPMRFQRWALSDLNPALWPLRGLASAVESRRKPCSAENPFCRTERMCSAQISASLNLYRDLRDAAQEAIFYQVYGGTIAAGIWDQQAMGLPGRPEDILELPFVKQAIASMDRGGYPEAMARMAAIIGHRPGPMSLDDLRFLEDLVADDERLSLLTEEEIRRIRGEQLVIVSFEPARAFNTLPMLLTNPDDRHRALELLERLPHIRPELSVAQRTAIEEIKQLLDDRPLRSTPDETLALAT